MSCRISHFTAPVRIISDLLTWKQVSSVLSSRFSVLVIVNTKHSPANVSGVYEHCFAWSNFPVPRTATVFHQSRCYYTTPRRSPSASSIRRPSFRRSCRATASTSTSPTYRRPCPAFRRRLRPSAALAHDRLSWRRWCPHNAVFEVCMQYSY